jgi:multisubunit Na+/H+ antiporter MnhF subunit
MINQICGSVYNNCCDLCNGVIEITQSVVSKTAEIAIKIFRVMYGFSAGFLLGAFVGTMYAITAAPHVPFHVLGPNQLALIAIVIGLIVGIIWGKEIYLEQ